MCFLGEYKAGAGEYSKPQRAVLHHTRYGRNTVGNHDGTYRCAPGKNEERNRVSKYVDGHTRKERIHIKRIRRNGSFRIQREIQQNGIVIRTDEIKVHGFKILHGDIIGDDDPIDHVVLKSGFIRSCIGFVERSATR